MADPFLAEIRIFSFAYAPAGWALCNGQLLPISQNTALFSLLGTMYGGDGKMTFALPDLRDRTPIHVGAGFVQGGNGGQAAHTLSVAELPAHAHSFMATTANANAASPAGNVLAVCAGQPYVPPAGLRTVALNSTSIGAMRGGLAHNNLQPYLTLNFCIALQGIYPSQT